MKYGDVIPLSARFAKLDRAAEKIRLSKTAITLKSGGSTESPKNNVPRLSE